MRTALLSLSLLLAACSGDARPAVPRSDAPHAARELSGALMIVETAPEVRQGFRRDLFRVVNETADEVSLWVDDKGEGNPLGLDVQVRDNGRWTSGAAWMSYCANGPTVRTLAPGECIDVSVFSPPPRPYRLELTPMGTDVGADPAAAEPVRLVVR